MAESTTKKKLLTKVASEFQVSADQIVDFLKTKGHDKIKRTSSVDEQMYNELAAHFKKELDQVEKRLKIKEQLTEKQEEKVAVKKLVDTVTIERHAAETKVEGPVEQPAVLVEVQPPPHEQVALESAPLDAGIESAVEPETAGSQVELENKIAPPPQEQIAVGESARVKVAEPVTPVVAREAPHPVALPPVPPKDEPGLKIRGRMDLRTGQLISEEELRLRKELEEAQKKTKEAEALLGTESQSQKKKKKKKKKIREGSTETAPPVETPEEDVKKKKKKKGKHPDVDQAEVDLAFNRTMASLEEAGESERAAIRRK